MILKTIEEVDEALGELSKRSSFFFKDEIVEIFGEEWVEANPAFSDIYSLSTILNAALDIRIELFKKNEAENTQLVANAATEQDDNQEEECTPIEVGSP